MVQELQAKVKQLETPLKPEIDRLDQLSMDNVSSYSIDKKVSMNESRLS